MIIQADARHLPIASSSVQCVVTSPPYWGLRDYGISGQLGLERTPEEYVANMVDAFREVRRVIKDDGTLWLNIGDSYAGSGMTGGTNSKEGSEKREGRMFHGNRRDTVPGLKQKDLVGIPWRVAFALQADGWYLRQDIIWSKPSCMPESVRDRCTKSHEYLFLMAKSERYFYDNEAIFEPLASTESEVSRIKIMGRGEQAATAAYLGAPQRDHSGGFPPSYKGSSFTKGKTAHGKPNIGNGQRFEHAGRNKRSVWTIATTPYAGAHFATFPEKLVETCLLAGSRPGDLVLDPFVGSGTVIRVATRLQRRGVGCDLNFDYLHQQARKRSRNIQVELLYPEAYPENQEWRPVGDSNPCYRRERAATPDKP